MLLVMSASLSSRMEVSMLGGEDDRRVSFEPGRRRRLESYVGRLPTRVRIDGMFLHRYRYHERSPSVCNSCGHGFRESKTVTEGSLSAPVVFKLHAATHGKSSNKVLMIHVGRLHMSDES